MSVKNVPNMARLRFVKVIAAALIVAGFAFFSCKAAQGGGEGAAPSAHTLTLVAPPAGSTDLWHAHDGTSEIISTEGDHLVEENATVTLRLTPQEGFSGVGTHHTKTGTGEQIHPHSPGTFPVAAGDTSTITFLMPNHDVTIMPLVVEIGLTYKSNVLSTEQWSGSTLPARVPPNDDISIATELDGTIKTLADGTELRFLGWTTLRDEANGTTPGDGIYPMSGITEGTNKTNATWYSANSAHNWNRTIDVAPNTGKALYAVWGYAVTSADDFGKVGSGGLSIGTAGTGDAPTGPFANDGYYLQTANIGTAAVGSISVTNTNNFSGLYDGGGKTAWLKLAPTSGSEIGMFGAIDGGTVKNLKLAGSIKANGLSRISLGSLAGTMSAATVRNISSAVMIYSSTQASGGDVFIGGIAGSADLDSTISDCVMTGDITGDGGLFGNGNYLAVGGIVGIAGPKPTDNTNTQIVTRCLSLGAIDLASINGDDWHNWWNSRGGIAGIADVYRDGVGRVTNSVALNPRITLPTVNMNYCGGEVVGYGGSTSCFARDDTAIVPNDSNRGIQAALGTILTKGWWAAPKNGFGDVVGWDSAHTIGTSANTHGWMIGSASSADEDSPWVWQNLGNNKGIPRLWFDNSGTWRKDDTESPARVTWTP